MRAAVLSEHDLVAWRAAHDQGIRPTPLPYDLQHLEPLGWTLRGAARTDRGLVGKVRDVVEHRVGYPVEQTLRLAPVLRSADVAVALLETQGKAAVRAKARGWWPKRTPLVVWSCWLAERFTQMGRDQRRAAAKRWSAADLITTYSHGEVDILVEAGIPADRVCVVHLGAAADAYRPDPEAPRDGGIVAIGQDHGRDYATLFEAVSGTDLRVRVVCKPGNLHGLTVPDEVELVGTVDHAEYRRMVQRAEVVAIPTHELAYPTGSSVMLEASASGACVAVTSTAPMREYVTDATAALVPVGDADAWRATLTALMRDRERREALGAAARAEVERRLSTRTMWATFDEAVRDRVA